MSDAALARRDAFADLVLPAGPVFTALAVVGGRRALLQARETSAAALGAALGPDLTVAVNRAAEGAGRAALRLGPEEWLLEAADGDDLAVALATAAVAHALVDVSDRFAALDLTGAHLAEVLNAGVPLDLDPDAFPVGAATRTLFHKAEVVLWRRGVDEFRLEVARSFAPYLVGCLAEAARSVAAPV
ncbi:MAG: sarcosine oxidase subunit gamma family protein [Siculibacillus sp.]